MIQFEKSRIHRNFVLLVVFVGLALDYLLLTAIEPIAPYYLKKIKKDNSSTTKAEDLELGILFASKSFVQCLFNPICGWLILKIGYSVPLFGGFIIMILSTLCFAFGDSFMLLLIPRVVQGIGAACCATAGFGITAELFTEENERSRAMGIALAGSAFGLLFGAPFGGGLYQLFNEKIIPFLILAGFGVIGAILQMVTFPPQLTRPEKDKESSSMMQLLADPYIALSAVLIVMSNLSISVLSPGLSLWMIENWRSSAGEVGLLFLPSCISYFIGTQCFSVFSLKIGRWICLLISVPLTAICLASLPFATNQWFLIPPITMLGLSLSIIETALTPLMADIVDWRYSSDYGNVYAITDGAMNLAFFTGPLISGILVKLIGFKWMVWLVALSIILCTPASLILRSAKNNSDDKRNQTTE